MIPLPDIDEQATIKATREFLAKDYPRYKQLSLSRFATPSLVFDRMPGNKGDNTNRMERRQVVGADASAVVDEVEKAVRLMSEDNRKLIELRYFKNVPAYLVQQRLSITATPFRHRMHKALIEFAMIYGIYIIKGEQDEEQL